MKLKTLVFAALCSSMPTLLYAGPNDALDAFMGVMKIMRQSAEGGDQGGNDMTDAFGKAMRNKHGDRSGRNGDGRGDQRHRSKFDDNNGRQRGSDNNDNGGNWRRGSAFDNNGNNQQRGSASNNDGGGRKHGGTSGNDGGGRRHKGASDH